jgi:hypothetical protein
MRAENLTAAGKVRLLTHEMLDCRTQAARIAKSLIDQIEADLGGSDQLTAAERQIVKRAAVLGAFCENSKVLWMTGKEMVVADYLMACNVQRRLLATLGLKRRTRDITPKLRDYLDNRADCDEADSS